MFRRKQILVSATLPDGWAWAGGYGTTVHVTAADLPGFGVVSGGRVVAELTAVHPSAVGPTAEATIAARESEGAGGDRRHGAAADMVPLQYDRSVILARRPGRKSWDAVLSFRRRIDADEPETLAYRVTTGAAYVSGRAGPSRLAEALVFGAARQIAVDAAALASHAVAGRTRPELQATFEAVGPGMGCGNLVGMISDAFETAFTVDLRYPGRTSVRTLDADLVARS
jgi:hypothetical protein